MRTKLINDRGYKEEYINHEYFPLEFIKKWETPSFLIRKHLTRKLISLAARLDRHLPAIHPIDIVNDIEIITRSSFWIPTYIKRIPYYKISRKVILRGISAEARMIKDLPKDLLTVDIIEAALKIRGRLIRYIPEHLMTKEIVKLAIEKIRVSRNTPMIGRTLKYIPEHLLTPEIIRIALIREPRVLKYVKKRLQTPELCFLAMDKNIEMAKYVRLKGVVDEYKKERGLSAL